MAQPWVVTCRIARTDDSSYGMAEFFRGSEAECKRIGRHFAGGSCDIISTSPWQVIIGPAADWDGFLREVCGNEEEL